jgi:hypothetical protein
MATSLLKNLHNDIVPNISYHGRHRARIQT